MIKFMRNFWRGLLLFSLFLSPYAEAAKLVSMSPAITESLFALGLGKSVVGVSQYCQHPKEVQNLPHVGTPFTPNYEKILKLDPNTVLTQGLADNSFSERLGKIGVKVLSYDFNTLNDIKTSLSKLGDKFESTQTKEVLKSFKKKENFLKNLNAKGRYLAIISINRKLGNVVGFKVATSQSYLGEILDMTGLENAAKGDQGYIDFSLETFFVNPPERIFIFTVDKKLEKENIKKELDRISSRPLKTKVSVFKSDYAVIPGPRLPQLMSDIAYEFKP